MATTELLAGAQLIAQGAEASADNNFGTKQKVYKAALAESPVLLKHRFTKTYRHSTLDASLTKQRVSGEARALLRCLKCGVSVPGIRFVHADSGLLGIEWINGSSVRKALGGGAEGEEEEYEEGDEQVEVDINVLKETYGLTEERLMELIGAEIAKMHRGDIIHGDLTTSNMMLRKKEGSEEAELVLIDFGLSFNSPLVEDKAVDLYVLERAFSSTHPDSEGMFSQCDCEGESEAWLAEVFVNSCGNELGYCEISADQDILARERPVGAVCAIATE
ncbi:serine/threonine-protein kinase bud32 [Ceratobasidium sp. 414]|nr:serine/threonine-protein kinase bud32 [Ceratobasidium sp. 414]